MSVGVPRAFLDMSQQFGGQVSFQKMSDMSDMRDGGFIWVVCGRGWLLDFLDGNVVELESFRHEDVGISGHQCHIFMRWIFIRVHCYLEPVNGPFRRQREPDGTEVTYSMHECDAILRSDDIWEQYCWTGWSFELLLSCPDSVNTGELMFEIKWFSWEPSARPGSWISAQPKSERNHLKNNTELPP